MAGLGFYLNAIPINLRKKKKTHLHMLGSLRQMTINAIIDIEKKPKKMYWKWFLCVRL